MKKEPKQEEPLLDEVKAILDQYDAISAKQLMERFSISYSLACVILDLLNKEGLLSEPEGLGKPRKVIRIN